MPHSDGDDGDDSEVKSVGGFGRFYIYFVTKFRSMAFWSRHSRNGERVVISAVVFFHKVATS